MFHIGFWLNGFWPNPNGSQLNPGGLRRLCFQLWFCRVRGCPSGSWQNPSGSQRSSSFEYGFCSGSQVFHGRCQLNPGGSWLNPCGCWSNTTGSQQGVLPTVVVVVVWWSSFPPCQRYACTVVMRNRISISERPWITWPR